MSRLLDLVAGHRLHEKQLLPVCVTYSSKSSGLEIIPKYGINQKTTHSNLCSSTRISWVPIGAQKLYNLNYRISQFLLHFLWQIKSWHVTSTSVHQIGFVSVEHNVAFRALIGKCIWKMFWFDMISQISLVVCFEIDTNSTIFWAISILSHVLIEILKLLKVAYENSMFRKSLCFYCGS